MLGYCTNVHAGATYSESIESLRQHAMAVKQRVSPNDQMGVGWWLSREGVRGLRSNSFQGFPWLKKWFEHHGLVPFTCNGFPYGDFHGPTVKHRVYEPSWTSDDRLAYTLSLSTMLVQLSDAGSERSISTLPIGWPNPPCEVVDQRAAAINLVKLAEELRQLEKSSGVLIHVDLEPEPGCILQRSGDVVLFFKHHLLPAARDRGTNDATIFRHIRVCHDICHAAVMFEDQAEMFAKYLNRRHKRCSPLPGPAGRRGRRPAGLRCSRARFSPGPRCHRGRPAWPPARRRHGAGPPPGHGRHRCAPGGPDRTSRWAGGGRPGKASRSPARLRGPAPPAAPAPTSTPDGWCHPGQR